MQVVSSERKDHVCTEGDDSVEGEEDCGGDDENDGACGDLCTERALYLWCNMLVLVITCTEVVVVQIVVLCSAGPQVGGGR